jgi:hypothetical protein
MKTRKQLKEEYKQMKFTMGVFRIVNKVNGKVFIGSSPDLKAIWNSQRFQLEAGMHQNAALQKDWKEFGPENFAYEIIEELPYTEGKEVDYPSEIKALEQLIMDQEQPYGEKGYHTKPKYKQH